MEKQVPTVEVEIGEEKVELYKWSTQEEENNLQSMFVGDMDLSNSENIKEVPLTLKALGNFNMELLKIYCKTPNWEVINVWEPSLRKSVLDEIYKIREKN